jgi:hypothetical protein
MNTKTIVLHVLVFGAVTFATLLPNCEGWSASETANGAWFGVCLLFAMRATDRR